MITFGLDYERAKEVVRLDAVHVFEKALPVGIVKEEFVEAVLDDYPCDQLAYETGDLSWLDEFPTAFDVIVGAA